MNYSRRQLEAMGEPLGESVTRLKPGGRIYGGGGGAPSTTTTVNQSNIPEYLRPQVETVLGGSMQELFKTNQSDTDAEGRPIYDITGTKPYVPYSTNPEDYVAGFEPLQEQVQYNAANLRMPGQFDQATDYADVAGQGGLNSAARAAGYGNAGFQSGQMGQALGTQAEQQAAYNASMAQNQAYGYGDMGTQAGMQGQQSGLLGQQTGMQGGEYYGDMGAGYGAQGAQAGMQGGEYYGDIGAGYGAQGAQAGMQGGQYYGGMGADYGAQAANMAGHAQGFGQNAADIGSMGLSAEQYGRRVSGQAEDYAGQAAAAQDRFTRQATDPSSVQQYMSPYQQAVTENQLSAARRQADISRTQRGTQAVRAGTFGGSRQAIENAEAEKNLQSQLANIQASGDQTAYDRAIQAMQYGSNLNLQGLGGAQSGLGTALQGGQLGLSGIGQAMAGQQAGMQGVGQAGSMYGLGMQGAQSGLAGLNAANQFYGTGMQGAGMGLQGLQQQLAGTAQGMQGAQIGMSAVDRANAAAQLALSGADRQLAGTAQGMQGAGMGMQGVNTQLAGTAQGMQGAQAGLQGVNAQLAGTAQGMQGAQSGMQGAGVGLSGVGQAINAGQYGLQGAQTGLQGTAQGMQGAQAGLQGVSGQQAGYGLVNQSAGQLGQLGTQQLASQQGILGLQNQIGGQQQAQRQQIINQAIQNYANQREAPMQTYNQFNSLLRGYALPGTTATQYQAQPTLGNQLAGFGTAAVGATALSNAMGKKKGGTVRSGIANLGLYNAMH